MILEYEWALWLGFGLVAGFSCGYMLRDFKQWVKEEEDKIKKDGS